MEKITLFTDGGAVRNGHKDCRAAWAVWFGENDDRNKSGKLELSPSNQHAELEAIHQGLLTMKDENRKTVDGQKDETYKREITIVTDSKYSIDCLTKWFKTWKKNGWKTYKGDKVKHSTLIQSCHDLMSNDLSHCFIHFRHVNSHQIPPTDKDSAEYLLWKGNYEVDLLIKQFLSGPNKNFKLPKGQPLKIAWDGDFFTNDEDQYDSDDEQKHEKKKSKKEKSAKEKKPDFKKDIPNEIEIVW